MLIIIIFVPYLEVFFLLLIHTCFTLQEKKEKLHLMHTPLSSQTQSTLTHWHNLIREEEKNDTQA